LTHPTAAANLHLAVDDDHLRRKSSVWSSYPLEFLSALIRKTDARVGSATQRKDSGYCKRWSPPARTRKWPSPRRSAESDWRRFAMLSNGSLRAAPEWRLEWG